MSDVQLPLASDVCPQLRNRHLVSIKTILVQAVKNARDLPIEHFFSEDTEFSPRDVELLSVWAAASGWDLTFSLCQQDRYDYEGDLYHASCFKATLSEL